MNKNTKIWLNYSLGAVISVLLLWGIYMQVKSQAAHLDIKTLTQTGPAVFIWLCICLMPVNVFLETYKWYILAASAQKISFIQAFSSYLAGIAFSLVTPNRIGEYPARILYLKRENTFRLISVSILGAIAQLCSLFAFGLLGLIYYNISFPGIAAKAGLASCVLMSAIIVMIYWKFERWLPLLQKINWLRKFNIYGQLLKRFSSRQQIVVLLISLTRFGIFTAQYLFLLRWLNVNMPLADGFCMSALFFWTIGVIPSIALAELGERGQVGLYLFHHLSANSVGILGATIGIWFLNLVLPSVIGSILIIRMKILK